MPDTGTQSDPFTVTSERDIRTQLLRVVDQLPELQKTIVLLFYWQDQGINDISELLALGPNTIKSHLRRARMKLAQMLGGSDIDD